MTLNTHSVATIAPQLDAQQIALLKSLRNGALLPQLLRTYREQATRQITELRTAIDSADHAVTNIIAHTLKSASFSIGAKCMGELCAQIESNARNQQAANNAQLGAELIQCFDALQPELDAYIKG